MDTGILATGHGKPTAAAGKVKAAQQNAELQSSEASPAPEQKPVKVDVESVDFGKVVSKVTEVVQKLGTKVAFSYDDRADQPIIRVFDDESGELIRQIPREDMLDLMAKLKDISGIIFHESA